MTSGLILLLTLITSTTVLIAFVDKFILAGKRQQEHERIIFLGLQNSHPIPKPSKVIIFAREYWYWFVIIYLVRAFGFESFTIPSTSMLPTMTVGDQVLVKKFSYALHDPIFRTQLLVTGEPERGDIVVFRNPEHPDVDYIKRVIGLPGDTIVYQNKSLRISHCIAMNHCSNVPVLTESNGDTYTDSDGTNMQGYTMSILDQKFQIAVSANKMDKQERYEYVIESGEYFVMGDNRDNSYDSRQFGLIKHDTLVGEAVGVWASLPWLD